MEHTQEIQIITDQLLFLTKTMIEDLNRIERLKISTFKVTQVATVTTEAEIWELTIQVDKALKILR